jgi:KipI family sensor histidine kinase inhibitor
MQNIKFTPLNESSILLSFGDRINEEVHTIVMQTKAIIESNSFPGFIETVPAYTTLAVYYNPVAVEKRNETVSATVVQILQAAFEKNTANQFSQKSSFVEIPVCYDPAFAPDLNTTANSLNLSIEELITIHSGKTYNVFMLGFTPGFPYMGTIDERIFTLRKTQPRLKVEPGSVAIAGNQTGIYPFATPGGWNIIGRTPLQLFDHSRSSPFLLKAGDEVKFKAIAKEEFEKYIPSGASVGRSSTTLFSLPTKKSDEIKQLIHIEQSGFLTTLQDTGRTNYLQFGVNKGGAMDVHAAQLANTLLGNETTAAVLEITQSPHRFRFMKDALVAFTGAGLQPQLQETLLPINQPLFIPAAATVECKQPLPGFRLYMAVGGGFAADDFLYSCSTDLLVKAGGYQGRSLRKGDVLMQHNGLTSLQQQLLKVLKAGATVEINHELSATTNNIIRVLTGVEWNYLDETSARIFKETVFTIGSQSSRMGYRLNEKILKTSKACEIISSPVTQGSIQLTPSGEMIVLMADAQTVGGYPRIAQVCNADLSLLAQKKPGDKIQFQIVSLQEAEELYMKRVDELKQIEEMLRSKL